MKRDLAAGNASASARTTEPLPDIAAARALHERGHLDEAERIYTLALERDPGDADVLRYLGLMRVEQGRVLEAHNLLTAALTSYEQALEHGGDKARISNKRGQVLYALQRYFEGLVAFDRALELKPDWAEAHANRGLALYRINRLQAAIASFDKALALKPQFVEAHAHRGRALHKLNRYDEALASFDRALALKPDHALTYNLRGETLACLTRYEEAAAHYEIASKLDPQFIQPRWNAAVTRLQHGDFQRGWEEYECRWKNVGVAVRDFGAPLWLGQESIAGRTILLHAEQGFGDTIQFVRYASLAVAHGANVILEVQAELQGLLSRMAGVSAVLAQPKERTEHARIDGAPAPLAREQDLPAFDCHCPMLSLPLAFKTELTTVPARIPYLHADPKRTDEWNARLPRRHLPLVGMTWSGNPHHWEDRNRSIALGRLRPLLSAPFAFVSLQKKVTAADAKLLPGIANLVHFGDALADFDDTAAVIASLDLVITVDTAVAHLAGAMGKPVWLLLAHAPEWRWLLEREDTPWYPNMRLYRQPRLDDWESVIEQVCSDLVAWEHAR